MSVGRYFIRTMSSIDLKTDQKNSEKCLPQSVGRCTSRLQIKNSADSWIWRLTTHVVDSTLIGAVIRSNFRERCAFNRLESVVVDGLEEILVASVVIAKNVSDIASWLRRSTVWEKVGLRARIQHSESTAICVDSFNVLSTNLSFSRREADNCRY